LDDGKSCELPTVPRLRSALLFESNVKVVYPEPATHVGWLQSPDV